MCNYRMYAECGAPIFKPQKGLADHDLTKLNVTYVEFEDHYMEYITDSKFPNKNMLNTFTKMVYYYYTVKESRRLFLDGDVMEYGQFVNTPRKGQYDFTKGGWKAFNSPF